VVKDESDRFASGAGVRSAQCGLRLGSVMSVTDGSIRITGRNMQWAQCFDGSRSLTAFGALVRSGLLMVLVILQEFERSQRQSW